MPIKTFSDGHQNHFCWSSKLSLFVSPSLFLGGSCPIQPQPRSAQGRVPSLRTKGIGVCARAGAVPPHIPYAVMRRTRRFDHGTHGTAFGGHGKYGVRLWGLTPWQKNVDKSLPVSMSYLTQKRVSFSHTETLRSLRCGRAGSPLPAVCTGL